MGTPRHPEWLMLAQAVKKSAIGSRIFGCLPFCLTESAVACQFKILSRATCFRFIRATSCFLLPSEMLQIFLSISSPLLNVLAILFYCLGVTGQQTPSH